MSDACGGGGQVELISVGFILIESGNELAAPRGQVILNIELLLRAEALAVGRLELIADEVPAGDGCAAEIHYAGGEQTLALLTGTIREGSPELLIAQGGALQGAGGGGSGP